MKQVLKLPAYRRLLAAYTLNELAISIGALALALLVYRQTGSAIGAAAYFLAAQFGPALIAPLLVARLDRKPVRRALPVLYTLEAVAFVGLALVVGHFSLALVLALALVDGVIAGVAAALARTATVAVTLPAGLMREGNAITNGSFSVCVMAGPALGGVLVALVGTVTTLLVVSGLYAVIVVALATYSRLPAPPSEDRHSRRHLRDSLRYARHNRAIRRLLLAESAAVVFFTIAVPVEVVFAERSLHAGAGGYAAILSVWGVGAVIGSVIYGRWRSLPGYEMIAFGAGLLGAGYLVMAMAPSVAIALLGAAIGGVGNGVEIVAVRTTLQEATEQRWMAMMISLNQSIFQAFPGIGFLLGGAIAALTGPRTALAVAGAGSLVITVAVWRLLRPRAAGADEPAATWRPDDPDPAGPLKAPARGL